MITLTRLSGSVFVLNSDLIERIDATPDSVVTLVDGKKYVVAESLEEVLHAVRQHRGEVLALSTAIDFDTWARAENRHRHLGSVSEFPATRLGRTSDETEA